MMNPLLGHEFGKPPVYQFTGFYHILCRVGGDANTDGALSVDVHDIAGRFHVSLFNDGDVAQLDLSAGGSDNLVADIIDSRVGTVGHDA